VLGKRDKFEAVSERACEFASVSMREREREKEKERRREIENNFYKLI